jgi:hypothetical protein
LHLCFADDILLFAEADVKQTETIMECLDMFCASSGQQVSIAKTKVYFSKNFQPSLARSISNRSGFSRTDDLGKY